MTMPLICDRWDECKERHDRLESWVRDLDRRVQIHGESIAALKVQVAMWAAVGALAGGAIVSAVMKLLVN
jgi:hypothetical protein